MYNFIVVSCHRSLVSTKCWTDHIDGQFTSDLNNNSFGLFHSVWLTPYIRILTISVMCVYIYTNTFNVHCWSCDLLSSSPDYYIAVSLIIALMIIILCLFSISSIIGYLLFVNVGCGEELLKFAAWTVFSDNRFVFILIFVFY